MDEQVEYITDSWSQLNESQRQTLVFRVSVMSGSKLIKAVLLGLGGVVISSVVSVIVFGVNKPQALFYIALAAFTGISIGYILGVRSS